MRRCTVFLTDPGPLFSLWVADQLDLLQALATRVIILDVIYDALTRNQSDLKQRQIKAFIDANHPPFIIEPTQIGRLHKAKKNAAVVAVADFVTAEFGLPRFLATGEPILMLFEDLEWFVTPRLPNLRVLSTVKMLRELEAAGVIKCADAVLTEMTHPTGPGRKPSDARALSHLF